MNSARAMAGAGITTLSADVTCPASRAVVARRRNRAGRPQRVISALRLSETVCGLLVVGAVVSVAEFVPQVLRAFAGFP